MSKFPLAAIRGEGGQVVQLNVKQNSSLFGKLEFCHIKLKNLEEAKAVSEHLSSLFPKPETVLMGIHELLVNAIEHGNLGIGYHKKTELLQRGTWQKEIEQRLLLPENSKKNVEVSYRLLPDHIELIIQDEGKGFEWEQFLEIDSKRMNDTHGRGIALSKILSFDVLTFEGGGNIAKCLVFLNGNNASSSHV